ncbi:MAG: hypothetical protein KGL39_07150 [Patescibacteria group bacterium]|nr:hypothetical protein [Patescibacteria group bacterium]
MRYEHIELDISTATCVVIEAQLEGVWENDGLPQLVRDEIQNFVNNLRARLQRRDVDPHCPLNAEEEWPT